MLESNVLPPSKEREQIECKFLKNSLIGAAHQHSAVVGQPMNGASYLGYMWRPTLPVIPRVVAIGKRNGNREQQSNNDFHLLLKLFFCL
jgi:hypothetical protein